MFTRLRLVCYGSVLFLLAFAAAPLGASVAYISNCCQYPSTVNVVDTHHGRTMAQWTVGTYAYGAVFSPDGKRAYISNEVSMDVTVVDVATGKTMATIALGHGAQQIVMAPDGRKAYVATYDPAGKYNLLVIDTASNTVAQTVPFKGLGPIAVSPDGKTLYIYGSKGTEGGLLAVDSATFKVKSAVSIYIGVDVAVSPDGHYVYVPNFGSFNYTPNVAVIDTATSTVVANVALGTDLDPSNVQVSPDGSSVWVSGFPLKRGTAPAITVIQTSTNQMAGQITLLHRASPGAILFAPSGDRAYVSTGSGVDVVNVAGMKAVSEIGTPGLVVEPAISPDGAILLLPNTGNSRAAAIDESTGTVLASIPAGDMDLGNPNNHEYGGAAVSPDGSRAYVTNYFSNNVTVIDTATKKAVADVPTGDEPVAVVFAPDGKRAYVANSYSNSVTAIDTKTLATRQIRMPSHTYPMAIAITPDGAHLYVAGDNPQPDFGDCHCFVFVVDTATDKVVSSIKLDYPVSLAASPDGTKVYAVGGYTSLYTISTATNTIARSVSLGVNGNATDPVTGGMVVTPDGTRVFATDGQDGSVFEVDVTTNKLIKTIPTGTNASAVALSPDGTEVWVGDYYSTSVSVIDVASSTVTRKIPLGNPSYGIAFGPQ